MILNGEMPIYPVRMAGYINYGEIGRGRQGPGSGHLRWSPVLLGHGEGQRQRSCLSPSKIFKAVPATALPFFGRVL
jgi:hypothetical protein